jgi:hypothetical protein
VLAPCLAATRYNPAVPIIVFAGAAVITRIGIYRSYLLSVLEDEASGPG